MTTDLKGKHGLAKLYNNNGSLAIRFPKAAFPGKHAKKLSLGLKAESMGKPIRANWDRAERLLTEINNDLLDETLDLSLKRYQPKYKQAEHKERIKEVNLPTLKDLYGAYVASRWQNSRPGTKREYSYIARITEQCPYQDILKPLLIVDWVHSNRTDQVLNRFLLHCNAAYKFGQDIDLIKLKENPWIKVKRQKQQRRKSQKKSVPIALSADQQQQIISAFQSNSYYQHYWQYVAFSFTSGMRPEEALPLYWSDFAPDFSKVAISRVWTEGRDGQSGKFELVEGLKTQQARIIPLVPEAQALMQAYAKEKRDHKLVFPSPKGKFINPSNFSRRAWKKVVQEGLGLTEFTPYKNSPYIYYG